MDMRKSHKGYAFSEPTGVDILLGMNIRKRVEKKREDLRNLLKDRGV
jgi:hypothetical protein